MALKNKEELDELRKRTILDNDTLKELKQQQRRNKKVLRQEKRLCKRAERNLRLKAKNPEKIRKYFLICDLRFYKEEVRLLRLGVRDSGRYVQNWKQRIINKKHDIKQSRNS